jgi:hypothetical protein
MKLTFVLRVTDFFYMYLRFVLLEMHIKIMCSSKGLEDCRLISLLSLSIIKMVFFFFFKVN